MKATLIALALTLCPVMAAAAPASDAAIVALAPPEPQFRGLLARLLFASQTIGQGSYALGIDATCATVRPAFDAAVAKHLPAWRANLIAAYRATVPAAVLDKATAAGPAAGRTIVRPYLDAVGGTMQKASEPLLKEAASEVLLPLLAVIDLAGTTTVDAAARGRELSKALDRGTAQCGLAPSSKRPV